MHPVVSFIPRVGNSLSSHNPYTLLDCYQLVFYLSSTYKVNNVKVLIVEAMTMDGRLRVESVKRPGPLAISTASVRRLEDKACEIVQIGEIFDDGCNLTLLSTV